MTVTVVSSADATLLLRNRLQEVISVLEAYDRDIPMRCYRGSVELFIGIMDKVSRIPMVIERWDPVLPTEEEALQYHQALLVTAWLNDRRYHAYVQARISQPGEWQMIMTTWVEAMTSALAGTATPHNRRLLGLTVLPVLHMLSANAVITRRSLQDLIKEIIYARHTAP